MHHSPHRTAAIVPLLACLASIACETAGTDRVLAIEATGMMAGIAYVDRDADENPGPTDTPAAGLRIGLLIPGTRDTAATTTTDENGLILLRDIPVGHYHVVLDPATVPDTLEVVRIDTAAVTVAADDTALIVITLRDVTATEADASAAPAARTPSVVIQQHLAPRATTTVASALHAGRPDFTRSRGIREMPMLARVVHLRDRPKATPTAARLRSAGLRPTRV